jgi:vanillate O-demethylase ferredoxin subunit
MSTGQFQVRLVRKTVEAMDICSFELVEAQGNVLPAFSAGSHIDVHLPNCLTRQYSLCNDPTESHRYVIGVLNDAASRGGSRAMHALQEGDLLQISAPRNHFPLAHAVRHSVLIAGGIGITPILCMAERLAQVDESFELHYLARSRDRMAFVDRIRRGAISPRASFHFDDGPPEQKLDLAALLAAPPADVHLYVCGPKGLMDAVLDAARRSGWPPAQLHCEFFAGASGQSAADQSFEVQLASSGRIVVVPGDQSVIQALAGAGISVQVSCGQGVCGTCLTRVLEGEPDHRDLYLTPEEQAANDQFAPCCSRAKSKRLVLDL